MMKMKITRLALAGFLTTGLFVQAQDDDDDEVFELSPFAVTASDDIGYRATTTLAGSRVRSNIGDLGASISIITEEFMQDTGATDGESLLMFVGNVEVGGSLGNFSNSDGGNGTVESRVNPQRGQRVRGLVSANLTRDYFQTDVPFDAYNTSRVTVNRGPNSILFGLGSPGGVINNGLKRAYIGSENTDISVRFDHRGSSRGTFDIGRTLIEDRLAIRVAGLVEDQQYKQNPASVEDNRLYIAWDATLFKNENSNWLGRTSIRGSYETGKIDSNPPDVIPPTDLYSSWWNGLGSQEDVNRILSVPGVGLDDINNAALTQANVRSLLDSGIETLPAGADRDAYIANEGQFVPRTTVDRFKRGNPFGDDPTQGGRNSTTQGTPYFLYPAINFNSVTSQQAGWNDPLLQSALGGFGIQGIMARFRPKRDPNDPTKKFATQDVRWTSAATGGTGFSAASITDRNVFDSQNNLFQGTTNEIITEFDMNQVFLEQELFGGRAGIELAFDTQTRTQFEFTPFDGGNTKAIQLDITQNLSPGDSNYDGVPDRLFNENLGRPVIRWNDNFERNRRNEQDTFRATLFGTLDFADVISNDKVSRWLGKHTLTGLYEDRENINLQRQVRGAWWSDNGKWPGSPAISNGLNDNFRRIVKSQVYLGPDARGFTSADQVRMDGYLTVPFPRIGDEYGVWYFDNGMQTDVQDIWRIIPSEGVANFNKSRLTSEAFSLQSTLLDGHVVALYAERSDSQDAYLAPNPGGYGAPGRDGATKIDLKGSPDNPAEIDGSYNLDLLYFPDTPNSVNEGDTTTKSLVVKFPEKYLFELPFGMDLQGHYYEADSFQPGGVSVNILNQPLSSPLGVTEEKGLQMTLLEGKLSIRYNEFETALANDQTNLNGGLNNIGGRIDFFLDRITSAHNDTATTLFPDGFTPDPNVTGDYASYVANPGSFTRSDDAALTPDTVPDNRQRLSGTGADIIGVASFQDYYDAITDAVLPELQAIRNHRVELVGGAWTDVVDPQPGLNSTRDFVSKGKEVDIVGQVTKNLTMFLNVAQQHTVTSNTAPVAAQIALDQAARLQRAVPSSPGGWALWDLRGSPFQRESDQIGQRFANNALRPIALATALDGTQLPEQREWRVNVNARYDFLEGAFKGFQVGGSLRYQDKVAGGYPNILNEGGDAVPDVANPYFGPDDINGDIFFRYGRKIMNDKVKWSIQLNARNLYRKNGNDYIPIEFNPDGAVTYVRVPVEQQWFLTNTFSF
jgi:outer membrane receptor protein involved in Fe transport